MLADQSSLSIHKGTNCIEAFRAAYENRYTWDPSFKGYRGECLFNNETNSSVGYFSLGMDFKPSVEGIENEIIKKSIISQLWEVAIHRVRRPFLQTHGENSFEAGDINDLGLEVIVGGKSKGDMYIINNKIVKMVYRHIHGSLVRIYTNEVINTNDGYLSTSYTSEYLDPSSGIQISAKRLFNDQFIRLEDNGALVLKSRVIEKESFNGELGEKETYKFSNLKKL